MQRCLLRPRSPYCPCCKAAGRIWQQWVERVSSPAMPIYGAAGGQLRSLTVPEWVPRSGHSHIAVALAGVTMKLLMYIALGAGLGVIYCWAVAASRTYNRLVVQKAPGAHLLPLLNKFAAILVALFSLVRSMIIIGSDQSHSWFMLAIFLCTWIGTAVACLKLVGTRSQ